MVPCSIRTNIILNNFFSLTKSKYSYLPSIRSIKGLMTVSTILPLTLLSFVPHQEPRFIIPLLLPLVYLYAPKILQEKESGVIKAESTSFKSVKVKKTTKFLYSTWLTINLILTVFYGYLHQGGVVSAMSQLSDVAKKYDRSVDIHLFSTHNYMLPQFLLLQRKTTLKIEDFVSDVEAYKKRFHVYDEGSKDLEFVVKKMKVVYNAQKMSYKKFKIFLLIPNSLSWDIDKLVGGTNLGLKRVSVFYPHLVVEVLPKIGMYYVDLFKISNFNIFCDFDSLKVFVAKLVEFFGLCLYEVSEKHVSQSDKVISVDKR